MSPDLWLGPYIEFRQNRKWWTSIFMQIQFLTFCFSTFSGGKSGSNHYCGYEIMWPLTEFRSCNFCKTLVSNRHAYWRQFCDSDHHFFKIQEYERTSVWNIKRKLNVKLSKQSGPLMKKSKIWTWEFIFSLNIDLYRLKMLMK